MRVLHIMQCTNLGGMEQVAFRLMASLVQDRGLTFRIVTPRPFGQGRDRVRDFDPMSRDFPYRGRFGWRDFVPFRSHVRALAQECSHIWVTGTSVSALAAISGLTQPKVLSHHYHHFEGRCAWPRWRLFYELLCRQLTAITYPTMFTRHEAVRIAPWLAERAVVVPNGFEIMYRDEVDRRTMRNDARVRLGLPADAYVVGNAGWLIARKRFDVFLATAALLRRRIPNSMFVICGGGPKEDELRSLSEKLGIEDCVRFEGWVTDLSEYYRAFDVLLFNSDFDTLPCAPMEAAAYGCPTVASLEYGGLNEFLVHGENGFLFAVHDPHVLADALVRIHDEPELAVRMRAAARTTLAARFTPEAGARFYRDFFQGVA